jgi:endonuclease/exonuclease/phosphatase family metal-dependent hydrolase
MKLRVATYNIHKGVNTLRRLSLAQIREQLDALDLDIICLQEVQGRHDRLSTRITGYPAQAHHDYLASGVTGANDAPHQAVYGMNAVYTQGHHGNAVLSHLPVLRSSNLDISHHRLESRGMLHALFATGVPAQPRINVVCVHLGLFAVSRRYQLRTVSQTLAARIPVQEPLIVAGDFNDWQGKDLQALTEPLQLVEAHHHLHGRYGLTFPARLPVMPLDRLFVRGLTVQQATVHHGSKWARLSDHALLFAELDLAI